MDALKKLSAVYMLCLAAAVTAHFIADPIYDPESTGMSPTIWAILNPMMVVGVVMALAVAFERKLKLNGSIGPVGKEYLEANCIFYFGSAFLIALVYNWVGDAWATPEKDYGPLWILLNTLFPILLVPAALRLLRR